MAKKNKEKEKYIDDNSYTGENGVKKFINTNNKNDEETKTIDSDGLYRICVYGANAKEGGKGGKQCATHYFHKNNEIKFTYESQIAGGKGGKVCGLIFSGDGYNGGGLSMAEFGNEFLIIGGGGGGNSESNGNKGGDYDENEYSKGCIGYNINNSKGGNTGRYCGGGGGNGFYGGVGGNPGKGGKGDLNCCKASSCELSDTNEKTYSGYEIIKKTK